ncbi:MAG: sugar transferase [Phototrophicaceae bacterium]
MTNQPQAEHRQTIEPRWLMPSIDVLLVFVAFGLGYLLRYEFQLFRALFDPTRREFIPYLPYALFYALMLVAIYQANGLYRHVRGRAWMEEVTIIAGGVANATVILLALYFMLQPQITSRLMLVYVAALTIILLSSARAIRQIVWAYLRSKGIGVQRVAIIGLGDVGQAVLRTLISRRELGYKVIGYLDDDPERGESDLGRVVGLGKLDNFENAMTAHGIDLVIITMQWRHYDTILDLTRKAKKLNVDVRLVPDIFQLNLRQVQFENLDGIPLLGINTVQKLRGTSRIIKRIIDLAIVIALAPIWGLIYIVVAVAIKLEDGGDIIYSAKRIGENGREFNMRKFRSMIPNADKQRAEVFKDVDPLHPKLVHDPRITKVGKFIRRTSIDEIPNFINVIRGEMSIVGPRPPLPDEVEKYENWHLQRLQTIPGITGLWQVSGRSEIPFDEMVLMDIYYIENWSVRFDLQIMLMTIPKVLLRSGAY